MGFLKGYITGAGMRQAVATALICGASFGSYLALTDDGGAASMPSYEPVPAVAKTTFRGPQISNRTAASGSGSTVAVVPHAMPGQSGGGASAANFQPSVGRSSSASGAQSAGALPTFAMPSGGGNRGGGGGGASAGGGSSYGGTVARQVSSGGGGGAIAMASGTSAASAPRRAPVVAPGEPTPGVYTGDAPGVITGYENKTLDNPITTSYGQPIGDALWPLLFFALLYFVYKRRVRQ